MAATILALASPALVGELHRLTTQSVDGWRARWGLVGLTVEVRASPWGAVHRPEVEEDGRWRDFAGETPATVFWPARTEAAIEEALYPRMPGEARIEGASLARTSTEHVMADLERALLACWLLDLKPEGAAGEGDWRASRWLAPVHVEVVVGWCRISAVVHAASQHAARRASPQDMPRLGRADVRAFHGLPGLAELIVGRAEIGIPDAAALQVGDVLVLDARIDEPSELRVQDGPIVLHAHLGRVGERRAVQLTAVSNAPEHS